MPMAGHGPLFSGEQDGVVDHRLPEEANAKRERSSGYAKVSTVRRLAEAAGFHFVGASQINANPRDTADWPQGVWTLPPSFALHDQDRARYAAIGESDRMTLRFVRPAGADRDADAWRPREDGWAWGRGGCRQIKVRVKRRYPTPHIPVDLLREQSQRCGRGLASP